MLVHVVGRSAMLPEAMSTYLSEGGHSDEVVQAWSKPCYQFDPYRIVEFMGRICYDSFGPGPNLNITRMPSQVPSDYVRSLIDKGHLSVLRHVTLSFAFQDVPICVTRELLRHQVGVAISEESTRYVRRGFTEVHVPEDISRYISTRTAFHDVIDDINLAQRKMASALGLFDDDVSMEDRKRITGALRYLTPLGAYTNFGWTANIQALRQVIVARTNPAADPEIRRLFSLVGERLGEMYPAFMHNIKVVDDSDDRRLVYANVK